MVTSKVKLGAALVGLGGANGAGLLAFKEDFFASLANWELKDFFGNNSPVTDKNSLELDSLGRQGVDLSSVASIHSPALNLHSESLIHLDSLDHSIKFSNYLFQFREEQEKERDFLLKLQFHRSGAQTIIGKLTSEDQKYFFDALVKIENYAKGSAAEQALTQRERQAVEKYYEVVSQLKENGVDLTRYLFVKTGGDTVSRFSDEGKLKRHSKLKDLLQKIKWNGPSIQVLGRNDKIVDGSESWGSLSEEHWRNSPWKSRWVGDSRNWGFDEGWDRNPWKEFFMDETEWRAFWEERFFLKKRYYEEWRPRRYWWWDNGSICPVNGVEMLEGCYSQTQQELAEVIDKANANISLQTGMKILMWMGYPLSGDRPKAIIEGRGVIKTF
ncbi:hypothetical protein MHLP_01385 [Candidatus Mycoplasma haematolamae str. Purdue]|uniref:Uncharacterized protein n=1 Tax=Mycoplasma haematolamae (strain Purdue) TaxID=1212765 RepID=I7C5R4_MYCHA|nr:hypothetical protein [Candidatus Mycoplasma haematolamae]AFO51857.1 hypothetical protein MHLP_01385 [Candidatus Mycoplasma haematolamae str. Purdue]